MDKHLERLKEIRESMIKFDSIEIINGDAEAISYAISIIEGLKDIQAKMLKEIMK